MTIFARNNRKNKVEEPKYTSSPIAPPVSPAYVPNRTNKALASYNTSQSDEQEESTEKKKKFSDKKKKALDKDETSLNSDEKASDDADKAAEKKEKVPKYKIVCLPLDTRSGRVLLVTKANNSNSWVLPKTDDEEIPQPEATAHAIAANIVGVEGRLISHIGEFTQSGKKRVKAYTNAYEFQVLNILSEYEHKETRGRKWFTYVEAMHILSDKPFQQSILRKASIAPKF